MAKQTWPWQPDDERTSQRGQRSFLSSRSPVTQPTTRREYRSRTAAKYTQPPRVQMYVMSLPHFRAGLAALQSWLRWLGAIGKA